MANPYDPPEVVDEPSSGVTFTIWKISRLKEDLARDRVPEKHAFLYLLLGIVLSQIWILVFPYWHDLWGYTYAALDLLAIILGTLHLYQSNGGPEGREFLTRYMSLLWVFGLRFLTFPGIPFFLIAPYFIEDLLFRLRVPDESYENAFFGVQLALTLLYWLIFYWRLGHHFREVRQMATSMEITEEGDDH